MSSIPSIVFVPGAWHTPEYWGEVIANLKQKGYHSSTVTLPSTIGNPYATLLDDITATQEVIREETDQGRDVILAVHSYGGAVGATAVKGLTNTVGETKTDSNNPPAGTPSAKKGHVVGLVLVATGLVQTGKGFMEALGGSPPSQWRINYESGFIELLIDDVGLQGYLYNDLSQDEAAVWISKLQRQAWRPLVEGGEHMYAGWKDVPCWLLAGIQDNAIPVEAIRSMVGGALAEGDKITYREVESSHSPMLSMPDAVTELIVEAAASVTAGN